MGCVKDVEQMIIAASALDLSCPCHGRTLLPLIVPQPPAHPPAPHSHFFILLSHLHPSSPSSPSNVSPANPPAARSAPPGRPQRTGRPSQRRAAATPRSCSLHGPCAAQGGCAWPCGPGAGAWSPRTPRSSRAASQRCWQSRPPAAGAPTCAGAARACQAGQGTEPQSFGWPLTSQMQNAILCNTVAIQAHVLCLLLPENSHRWTVHPRSSTTLALHSPQLPLDSRRPTPRHRPLKP